MSDTIEPGCRVDIYFELAEAEFDLEVLYVTTQPGDSWIFKRQDGTIIYVQHYAKMIRTWDGKSP